MTDSNQHSIQREDELREEFWAVAGDDLGSVATTNVARALTGLVRLLASTEEQLKAAQSQITSLTSEVTKLRNREVALIERGDEHMRSARRLRDALAALGYAADDPAIDDLAASNPASRSDA